MAESGFQFKISNDVLDSPSFVDISVEPEIKTRKDFPETWIFDEFFEGCVNFFFFCDFLLNFLNVFCANIHY